MKLSGANFTPSRSSSSTPDIGSDRDHPSRHRFDDGETQPLIEAALNIDIVGHAELLAIHYVAGKRHVFDKTE